jgi:hypothetical protein
MEWTFTDGIHALSECTETRMFQLLTRAIIQLPSGMDIGATQRSCGYSDAHHR